MMQSNLIIAQGAEAATSASMITPWNEDTDKNLRNFIQQRAERRMREINKEVDQVREPLFLNNRQVESHLQAETTAYLRAGIHS